MFYTYLWLREDGTAYYVGKGAGRRAYKSERGHRPPKDRTRIIVQSFDAESEALFAEQFLIAAYGRKDLSEGLLINLTDGGEGVIGHRHSLETKLRFSQLHNRKGKPWTAETRENSKNRRTCKGTKWSPEARARYSAQCKGRIISPEARANMAIAAKNRKIVKKGDQHVANYWVVCRWRVFGRRVHAGNFAQDQSLFRQRNLGCEVRSHRCSEDRCY